MINESAMNHPKILIYQSENCEVMAEYLAASGFDIISSDESDVVRKIKDGDYDLCILDHYRSANIGNLSLLNTLRRIDKSVPVIMISELSNYKFIIEAYDKGIDDYIVRPYNLEILVRKMRVILKRRGIKTKPILTAYELGNYIFNVDSRILQINEDAIKLTDRETQLLALLCAYKGEILQFNIIMRKLWQGENNYWNRRSLDVIMCHLRKYLNLDKRISILTKRGLGYSLVVDNTK